MAAYDECRSDWALATGRLLIAIALVASASGEVHAGAEWTLLQGLPFVYLTVAGVVLAALLTVAPARVPRLALAAQAADVTNAAAVLMLDASGGAVALAVGFSLIAAARRAGFLATVVAASVLAAVQLGQALVTPIAAGGFDVRIAAAASDIHVTRAGYILIAGLLLGYLAESDRDVRNETTTLAYVASRLDLRLGLSQGIAVVLDTLLRLFDAQRAVVVVRDEYTGRVTRWDRVRGSDNEPLHRMQRTFLEGEDADAFMLGERHGSVHVVRRGAAQDQLDARWLGTAPSGGASKVVEPLGDFQQVISVGIEVPGDWTGRVFLIDPHVERDRAATLKFAHNMVRRLVAPIQQVYLLRRVRSRSIAEERARIARELHDGIVQTVLGVQVQLHALAVQASGMRRDFGADLNRLGLTLREEVLKLRELMQRMKPAAPGPEQLMNAIAALVHRFETETGIRTRLITSADQVPLLPAACLEMMRIVQEALVNVRRHSGARNVFIRFNLDGDVCRLWFDDDGRGFPFEGRLSLDEMEQRVVGPAVMRDRVRRLGGQMTVESLPGRGSRIEISFPVSTYAL